MNYAKQLNTFEDYSDRTGLPAYAQLIYYKLFAMNNRAGWVEWFETTNHYLMFKTGIKDEKTLIKHRNLLKQNNLIDFVSGKKGQPTKYKIIEFDNTDKFTGINPVINPVETPVNNPVKNPVNVPVKTPDIYKHKLNNKKSTKKDFVPPTLDEVKAYCLEKGLSVNAIDFYKYFDTGDWIDSKGNKVRSWKQKILTWENHSKPKQAVTNNASYKPSNGKGVFAE